jgi:hypothetical protein
MDNETSKTIGNSCLDYLRFEVLSQEALRLIRDHKVRCPNKQRQIQIKIEDLKQSTKNAVTDRLSASQQ